MRFVFSWLLLLSFVVTLTTTTRGAPNKTPRLSPVDPLLKRQTDVSAIISSDFETFFYDQTLDHFNYKPESYTTFQQRYIINSKWWGGANKNAPIFVYLGAEEPIDQDVTILGFLTENAPRFKALLVYLEHRFYGESNPVRSKEGQDPVEAMKESVKNDTIRGYFNSAQALADYAELLLHIKNKLDAHNSPIIVIGGSYGGMLSSWFRLKYPHIALGALASSAPILYFDDITPQDGYYSIVTKDFKEASENCYATIKQSWDDIDRVATMPNGLAILSQKFKTCSPLNNPLELKDYLESMYASAAQYNAPPKYPTTRICQGIDGASNATDILDRVFAGVVAYHPGRSCYNMTSEATQTSIGWQWQVCSEMVIPIGITSNVSMFPNSPYVLKEFIDDCVNRFDVMPRPHWVTSYYGGQDIRLILSKFGSNIIFSNGLRDPYSSGGVLEDISENILALKTINGSHCLDILNSMETDPEWLVKQRKDEVKIISQWFSKYYQDLRLLKQ
ncbi:hypothetical protein L1987_78575 [Smallanthus sonchifolius]|uniref:Uncharacterized protein n=1 Tax=Smallanthus sonchifolius TaxID=185202 RepID=A0ACB8ZDA0_9ASTR|nr:hypothetical protein L1987_78575 [Smallanthus sonchifolius]